MEFRKMNLLTYFFKININISSTFLKVDKYQNILKYTINIQIYVHNH